MSEDNSNKGFSVVDRRIDSEEGEAPSEEKKAEKSTEQGPPSSDSVPKESSASSSSEAAGPSEGGREKAGQQAGSAGQSQSQPPPANLPSFLLSLHSAALIHLGLVPNPENNQTNVDLPLARYHIDLLEMLEKKTQGNLDQEEDKLIKNILYELRMAFLEVSKQ